MTLVSGERVFPEVIEGFAGEQRTLPENLLPPHVSPDALNIDYRDGTVRKRRGITRLGLNRSDDNTLVEAVLQYPQAWWDMSFFAATRNMVYRMSGSSVFESRFALATDGDRDFRAQLLAYRELSIALNGVAENMVCEYSHALSLPAPTLSSALTITAAGSGGSLSAGLYSYLFSIYNSTTGVESAVATQISSQTAVSNDRFTLDFTSGGWAPGSPAGADKIRVYRTKAAGAVYYHVADIAIASTSYVDGAADSALVTVRPTYLGYAAPSRFGFVLNGALWLGNQENFESRLVYTEVDTLGGFYAENYIDVGLGDRDELTGGIAVGDRAVVFKRRSAWLVGGAGDSVSAQMLFPGVGCVQHATIAASHDTVYWLGEGGVYAMALPLGSGAPVNLTLTGWRDFFSGMTNTDFEACSAVWDSIGERYLLGITTGGVRRMLVYCARQQAWALWTLEANGFCVALADGVSQIYCGWRGWLARLDDGLSDAAFLEDNFSQAMSGTATGGTTTTLVDSAAAWMTDDGGMLKGVDVTVVYADGTTATREVTGNTGTTLTVNAVWTAPTAGLRYFLGAIDAHWRTPLTGLGRWDQRKTLDRVRVLNRVPSDSGEAASSVVLYVELDGLTSRRETHDHAMNVRYKNYNIRRGLCRELVVGVEDLSSDQTFDIAGIALSHRERSNDD